ncbi:MAG TPA: GNAT family N-acetyltransferase [Bryobacteraceae bacterium]|jgi:ribosomal-protein-alanine N-acetyltransferase
MRAQYQIRPAGVGDLPRIAAIERASFGSEAYDCKLFAHYLRKCGELFLVAETSEKICGYLLSCVRGPAAELVSVAVAPHFRGKGAASALLESAFCRLTRRGAARLHLVVRVDNLAARAFYEKYGFRRLRLVRGYYEDEGDGVSMSRPVRLPCVS